MYRIERNQRDDDLSVRIVPVVVSGLWSEVANFFNKTAFGRA